MLAFSDVSSELDLYIDSKVRTAEERGVAMGLAKGEAMGLAKGMLSTLIELVKKKMLSIPQAAEQANMTVKEFEEKSGLKAE